MKCPKCGTEMNQGVYTVMPPIPYVDCPKCGYHKEGNDIAVTDDIIYLNDTVKILKDEVDNLRKQLNVARTDINDLTVRVSTLETDLERVKSATQADLIGLKFAIADMKTTALKKTPYYPPKNGEADNVVWASPPSAYVAADEWERARQKLMEDLEKDNKIPLVIPPKPLRYIYIIRERTCEFTAGSDWNIVGNVCYPTFNDANEKMKKLIKDYRQLDPDYNANNLNIIQVRLEG